MKSYKFCRVPAFAGMVLLIFSFAAACSSTERGAAKMKPGTYTGYGRGFSIVEKLPVHVTVSEQEILKIEVDPDNGETPPLLQTVIDFGIPRVIEHQSVGIDAVTGATITFAGFRTAVLDALQQALTAGGSRVTASAAFGKPVRLSAGTAETINVDVLVVGLGGSGSAAAMRAVEMQKAAGQPVSVLALEKSARYGGTSALTSHMMAVNPPSLVKSLNGGKPFITIKDLEDFRNQGPSDPEQNDMFWPTYRDRTGELMDWLISHGFVFKEPRRGGGLFGVVPVVFDYGGTFGGNKDLIATFFDKMIKDYEAAGGKYMLETEGYELIYDQGSNTVTGVKARNVVNGTEYVINAKAVIMATGGFGGNFDMVRKFNSNGFAYKLIGSMQNTGELVASAWAIGAGKIGDERGMNIHNAAPKVIIQDFPINSIEGTDYWTGRPATWSLNDVPLLMVTNMNTLFVGIDGKRYARESDMWPWWQGGEQYFSIFSQSQIDEYKAKGFDHSHTGLFFNFGYNAFPLKQPIPEMDAIMEAGIKAGAIVKGATLAELAQKIKAPPANLEAAVARYNELCAKGKDEDFGKPAEYLWAPGTKGPFYAVIGEAWNYSSSGGLTINLQCRVTKAADGSVINRLWATGSDALAYVPKGAFGGSAQTWAYLSGFLAAEDMGRTLYGK
jgi:fumarate reductase flavoprotein subunit